MLTDEERHKNEVETKEPWILATEVCEFELSTFNGSMKRSAEEGGSLPAGIARKTGAEAALSSSCCYRRNVHK